MPIPLDPEVVLRTNPGIDRDLVAKAEAELALVRQLQLVSFQSSYQLGPALRSPLKALDQLAPLLNLASLPR